MTIQAATASLDELRAETCEEILGVPAPGSTLLAFLYVRAGRRWFRVFIDEGTLFWNAGSPTPEDDLDEGQSYVDVVEALALKGRAMRFGNISMRERMLTMELHGTVVLRVREDEESGGLIVTSVDDAGESSWRRGPERAAPGHSQPRVPPGTDADVEPVVGHPQEATPQRAKLTIVEGPDSGREYEVPDDRTIVIGRWDGADINLASEAFAARRHARLHGGLSGHVVEDMSSVNGILVNGKRVETADLSAGDRIQIGKTCLVYDRPPALRPEMCGPFRLLSRLAEGPHGTAYLAEHTRSRDRAYVRVLAADRLLAFAAEPTPADALERVRGLCELQHAHILRVLEAGALSPDEPGLWWAIEFPEGRDLDELVHGNRRLPSHQVVPLVQEVSSALDHAHGIGFVHGSLRLADVRRVGNSARLRDIGLWGALTGSDSGIPTGFKEWLSPESLSGDSIGPATDQYAWGWLAFRMLTGVSPFQADATPGVVMRVARGRPTLPTSIDSAFPAAVDPVFARVLARHPSDRFPSCADFADALARALASRRD